MRNRICSLIFTLLLLCSMTGMAFAAEVESAYINTLDAPVEEQAPPSATVYPAEVRTSEENGVNRLENIYYLTAADDPSTIPVGNFEREGRNYTLLDLLRNDQTETETKEHIEIITRDSDTKDMAEIIQALEPELEISTEDGYTGILALDYTTIAVEAAGYKTSSRTVSATRTYPNLSDADVSLIPKSVEENGRTLTLANVDWQEAAADHADGYALALRYNAVATYTGTATSKYATGYTVTAEYKGEITKSSCDTIIYTAIFSSMDAVEASKDAGDSNIAANTKEANWPLILIPLGVVGLGAAGYGGKKWYTHYQNKKRGYE